MAPSRAPWREWYRSWEEQQESFNRNRERRFSAMLDLLAASLPTRFTALDLGCGPGSLSARILRRFPRARVVAVDHDPVVLGIGRGTLGSAGGRLSWVNADLGSPGWDRALPPGRLDGAVSTTALHWLDRPRLARLYRDLGRRVRRGGVVLNGDRMPWGDRRLELSRLAQRVRSVRRGGSRSRADWGPWRTWWARAERAPELRSLFALREGRAGRHPRQGDLPLAVHTQALRQAGFRTVEVVWRDLEDAILYARR
jgi:SAM-dependent methyltransferase